MVSRPLRKDLFGNTFADDTADGQTVRGEQIPYLTTAEAGA
jgi:hypothetical protein